MTRSPDGAAAKALDEAWMRSVCDHTLPATGTFETFRFAFLAGWRARGEADAEIAEISEDGDTMMDSMLRSQITGEIRALDAARALGESRP